MRWPSLFALFPNREEKRVNINQLVPVTLKRAFSLPATQPLPLLSTALTLSSHFFSQAIAAVSLPSNPAQYLLALIPGCCHLLSPMPSQVAVVLLNAHVTKWHHVATCSWYQSQQLLIRHVGAGCAVASRKVLPCAAACRHQQKPPLLFFTHQWGAAECAGCGTAQLGFNPRTERQTHRLSPG